MKMLIHYNIGVEK
jgi:predicted metalloprotease with PDZ domain